MRSLKKILPVLIEELDPWLFFLITATLLCSLPRPALAQPNANRPPPHLAFAYPAGGQQGTTFTVSVGGQNLTSAAAAYFSGTGISAKITGYERPLTQKEINDLREEAQKLQDKRTAARSDRDSPTALAS